MWQFFMHNNNFVHFIILTMIGIASFISFCCKEITLTLKVVNRFNVSINIKTMEHARFKMCYVRKCSD